MIDPATGLPLPPEGVDIPDPMQSAYWARKLEDGDISIDEPSEALTTGEPEAPEEEP